MVLHNMLIHEADHVQSWPVVISDHYSALFSHMACVVYTAVRPIFQNIAKQNEQWDYRSSREDH